MHFDGLFDLREDPPLQVVQHVRHALGCKVPDLDAALVGAGEVPVHQVRQDHRIAGLERVDAFPVLPIHARQHGDVLAVVQLFADRDRDAAGQVEDHRARNDNVHTYLPPSGGPSAAVNAAPWTLIDCGTTGKHHHPTGACARGAVNTSGTCAMR